MPLVPSKKPKGIVTDVDDNLTEGTTWYELTERLGADPYTHATVFMSYLNGELDITQTKKLLFENWLQNGPVHRDEIIEICYEIPLRGEAFATFSELQQAGYELYIISGSFDVFVQTVAERFNIRCWKANSTLIFDENGYWVDFDYHKDESEYKAKQLQKMMNYHQIKKHEIVAIGEDINDIEIFKTVPGIAINSDCGHLKRLAWKEIDYLPRIIQLLESIEQ